ncbi:MAG: hydrolase [Deltaproteobacteria bacterium]|nr:hydrolase [Deltaproteobacteria bacterium]
MDKKEPVKMISRADAVLIIIDIQGNLAQAMYDKENLFANNVKLIQGFKALNLPIIFTEQIPQKLGNTLPQIAAELDGINPVAKESFSCWDEKYFKEKLEGLNRRHIVLTGIECHVCVYQTALDLISNGYNVHLVTDAVSSRTPENRQVGIDAIKSAGAYLTSTEMVLFELLRTAADPKAKEFFKIVK